VTPFWPLRLVKSQPSDGGIDGMQTKNLDLYGSPPIPWERATSQFEQREFHGGGGTYWLSTTCADGRPHAAGVLGVWIDGVLYFASGARTLKSRNLQADSRCVVSASLADLDVVMEGRAIRVTDRKTLERVSSEFVQRGWPTEVSGDTLTAAWGAPSAPPPWHLYAVSPSVAFGVGTAETTGATRWSFD
jgi:hypothetical protein